MEIVLGIFAIIAGLIFFAFYMLPAITLIKHGHWILGTIMIPFNLVFACTFVGWYILMQITCDYLNHQASIGQSA